MLGVLEYDFAQTRQAYHPGVTTMWLGGLALHSEYQDRLSFPEQFLTLTEPATLSQARLPVAILTAIVILLSYFLLRRLLGIYAAMLAALFIACDPLYLAQSRRLHTDALATSFLLIAILTLLIYLENPKRLRNIAFSGFALGLAMLSKSNAMIFVLFLPFAFVLYWRSRRNERTVSNKFTVRLLIYAAFALLGIAALTVMAFWPAIWILKLEFSGMYFYVSSVAAPCLIALVTWSFWQLKGQKQISRTTRIVEFLALGIIGLAGIGIAVFAVPTVVKRIWWALTIEHNVPQMFFGKIVNDPGWLFYPTMLLIQTAPLTLILSIVGMILVWRSHEAQYISVRRIFFSLCIFVALFTLCQSIGAKKFSRYLLPAYPLLDILAAIGALALFEKSYRFLKNRISAVVAASIFFAVVIIIQTIPVLRLHPYYGGYHSPIWKATDVTKICSWGDGSGLDIAGIYLSQKPGADKMIVRTSPLAGELFRHYFIGKTYRWDKNPMKWKPNYDVVYIRDTQIGRKNAELKGRTPEKVIKVNGIEYVWIYKSNKIPMTRPTELADVVGEEERR